MSKQHLGRLILSHVAQPPRTVYVGETPADLSVYAEPGWDAWLAVWGLIGEWDHYLGDPMRNDLIAATISLEVTDAELDERIEDLRCRLEVSMWIRDGRAAKAGGVVPRDTTSFGSPSWRLVAEAAKAWRSSRCSCRVLRPDESCAVAHDDGSSLLALIDAALAEDHDRVVKYLADHFGPLKQG